MNWKASLLGALLVALSGLAVGAAIGGKARTKVIRVTVPAPTTLASQSTSTSTNAATTTATTTESPSGTNAATTTAEPSPEGASQQQFLAEYLASQDAQKLSSDASNVALDGEPTKQELQGQTSQQAVVFDIENSGAGDTASYQVPTPGFSRLSSKAAGLETISNAETYYKLTVYKNNDSSPASQVLYQATFHGPSEVHKMDFGLQGATDLLFVWTKKSPSEPDNQDVFILSDPVLTG